MQSQDSPAVSARGLHVWRGERHVPRGLSLEAAAGDCVHLAGPNGSGKTTLLRVLAGLLIAEEGGVHWRGRPIGADRDAYSAAISYLGHSDGLKPDFTARENLAFEVGLRRALDAGEIDAALARVGLSGSHGQAARSLSAGQRRRLSMARVMLARTAVWLLDEPFTNLDVEGVPMLAAVVAEHLDGGGSAIIASHQAPDVPGHPARRVDLAG